MQHDFRMHTNQFHHHRLRMLQALNPLSVMDRGYSIVYQKGDVMKSAKALQPGNDIQIQLQDGTVDATVQSVSLDHKEEL